MPVDMKLVGWFLTGVVLSAAPPCAVAAQDSKLIEALDLTSRAQSELEAGDLKKALDLYREALAAEPRIVAPSLFGYLAGVRPAEAQVGGLGAWDFALGVLRDDLLLEGHLSLAQESASRLLWEPGWAAHPESQELLAIVLEYYSRASISPAAFDFCDPSARERGEICGYGDALTKLLSQGHPDLQRAILAILRAYRWHRVEDKRSYERIESESEARILFPGWSVNQRYSELFSLLLVNIAGFLQLEENYDDALGLYTSAWLLYPGNVAAAVQTAAILSTDPERFDPDRRLVKQLTSTYAIQRTGSLSVLGHERPIELDKSSENLANLGQLYAYLYEISSGQDRGFLPIIKKANRPKYQATQAAKAVEFQSAGGDTSARNLAWLARAYEAGGQTARAAESYLAAAAAHTERCELVLAKEQLDALRRVMPSRGALVEGYNEVASQVEEGVCLEDP